MHQLIEDGRIVIVEFAVLVVMLVGWFLLSKYLSRGPKKECPNCKSRVLYYYKLASLRPGVAIIGCKKCDKAHLMSRTGECEFLGDYYKIAKVIGEDSLIGEDSF